MKSDYKDCWVESLSQIKKELGDEEYSLWFDKLKYIRSTETEIFVSVPNNFFLGIFSPRYLSRITGKICELSEKDIKVSLEIQKEMEVTEANAGKQLSKEEKTLNSGQKAGQIVDPARSTASNTRETAPETEIKKKSNPQLQEEYTFDNYVVGEANNYAFNVAAAVARNPGNSKIYNPVLIYGGTGLGKTHLMQAIGHYIHQNSDLKILYVTGEGFMREFVETMTTPGVRKESFAKKFRNVDALLVDDIHTIERGGGTQDELFYTFEALYNKKKQIVFTCDRPISELKNMNPRLQSRFKWGVSVELQLPIYEERIAILRKKMLMKQQELKKNIIVSDEIIDLIAKNISSNVRDMEGALNKLMGYADLINKPVTMEIAQRELKDIFADPKQGNMSIEIIQRVVAEDYNLQSNDLKGPKRTKGIVKPRHIAIHLCNELTDFSQSEIGEAFGGRDHSTIISSLRKIDEELKADANFYTVLERLKRKIKEYNVK